MAKKYSPYRKNKKYYENKYLKLFFYLIRSLSFIFPINQVPFDQNLFSPDPDTIKALKFKRFSFYMLFFHFFFFKADDDQQVFMFKEQRKNPLKLLKLILRLIRNYISQYLLVMFIIALIHNFF